MSDKKCKQVVIGRYYNSECEERKKKQLDMKFSSFAGEVQKEIEESISGGHPESESRSEFSGHMILAVFSMIWSTVVMELWKRRSSSLSYRWGTLHLTERYAEPRPSFHGELGVNPVTGRVEPIFPEWQRDLRIALVSLPVVLLFLGTAFPDTHKIYKCCAKRKLLIPITEQGNTKRPKLCGYSLPECETSSKPSIESFCLLVAVSAGLVIIGMLCFYWGESQVQELYKDSDSLMSMMWLYMPSILHVTYTNVLATIYRVVAQALTDFGKRDGERVAHCPPNWRICHNEPVIVLQRTTERSLLLTNI